MARNANQPGAPTKKAEKDKRDKYVNNGLLRRADNPKLFVLALETFGRRGKEFTAFLKLMAKTGEQTGYGEKWKFWQREVPKINAMLMLGNFNKAIAVRAHVMADLADRYRHVDFQ